MLYFRGPKLSDLNYFKAMYQCPENMLYIAGGKTLSDAECAEKLNYFIEQQGKNPPFGAWVVEDHLKNYVGLAYLMDIKENDGPTIGYFVDKKQRGKAHVYAMIDYLISLVKDKKVYAWVDENNEKSIYILEKSGFHYKKKETHYSSLIKAKQASMVYVKLL